MTGKGHKFLRRGDQEDVFARQDVDWAVEAKLLVAEGGARADCWVILRDAGMPLQAQRVVYLLRNKWTPSTVRARLTELAYPGRYQVRGAGLAHVEDRQGVLYYRARVVP